MTTNRSSTSTELMGDYRHIKCDNITYDEYELDINSKAWFKKVLELDMTKPDRRAVYWFWDEKGGAGKTMLAAYMEDKLDNRWISISSLGSMRDAAQSIGQELDNGWLGHGIIIDLGRRSSEYMSIYEPIEHIKNGRMNGTKYKGKKLRFRVPHVVIFSNKLPIMSDISMDRWRIHKIEDDEAYLMSTDEVWALEEEEFEEEEFGYDGMFTSGKMPTRDD